MALQPQRVPSLEGPHGRRPVAREPGQNLGPSSDTPPDGTRKVPEPWASCLGALGEGRRGGGGRGPAAVGEGETPPLPPPPGHIRLFLPRASPRAAGPSSWRVQTRVSPGREVGGDTLIPWHVTWTWLAMPLWDRGRLRERSRGGGQIPGGICKVCGSPGAGTRGPSRTRVCAAPFPWSLVLCRKPTEPRAAPRSHRLCQGNGGGPLGRGGEASRGTGGAGWGRVGVLSGPGPRAFPHPWDGKSQAVVGSWAGWRGLGGRVKSWARTPGRWGRRGVGGARGAACGGAARRLETGLLEGPPGHLAPALDSRTPRPCPFGRLLLLPFPQQALLQRTRASVPPTPLCPRSVAGSLAPRGCACPPRLETGLRGGAIGQQVRAPGWGAGGARPGLSQVAGQGSPAATKPRLARGSLATKGASTTPRVLAPGAAQCPGPRHFQEKQCPTFGGVHPSIAQLVERRTVAWTRVDILRSLVRFRLEGGA